MKFRALKTVVALAILALGAGTLYAANGDRFVDGHQGDGTSTLQGKDRNQGVSNSDKNPDVDKTDPAEKIEKK